MSKFNTIIIGSGISGLFTLKHLIEENNTDVLILDKNPEPFGIWNIENHPSVFENTFTVSSKLYMTISDFPMPDDMPEFPHHSLILKYYKDYAKHFDLYPYIKQNITVTKVEKDSTGIWVVTTSNNTTYLADHIVIASGTVNDCPNIPSDPCFENFTGLKLHSESFEKIKTVEGKKILIIGGSDTCVDLAMELKIKNKVTVSIKNGVWFQSRILGAYEAADMLYNRFIDFFIKNITTKKYIDDKLDPKQINNVQFFWGERGSGVDIWRSKCDYLNSYYVKSREIIEQISKGVITPQNGVQDIHGNKVTFKTGDQDSFDIILFATGFNALKCMNFLDEQINREMKYKHIFHIDDPSIMFVGFIRPYLTSIPMLSEMQSRWVSKIICGKLKLPPKSYMKQENLKDDLNQMKEFPCAYERLKTIVDPYSYCNMIADNIGSNINMFELFFTDTKLLYMIVFGSWNHHIYRLNDKNAKKREIALKSITEVFDTKISVKIRNVIYNSVCYYIFNVVFAFLVVYFLFNKIFTKKTVFKTRFFNQFKYMGR